MAADRMVVLLGAGRLVGLQKEGGRGIDFADSPNPAGLTVAWQLHSVHTGLHVAQSFGLDLVVSLTQLARFFRVAKEDKVGSHLASSWISRSISYKDKKPALHTQMRVVCSQSLKCSLTSQKSDTVSFSLEACCWSVSTGVPQAKRRKSAAGRHWSALVSTGVPQAKHFAHL